ILGESAPVRALRADVARIATLEAAEGIAPTVLLLGETGTGKGLVARALRHQSPRASGPFVDIHCAAIPPPLLEAELFGYDPAARATAVAGARHGRAPPGPPPAPRSEPHLRPTSQDAHGGSASGAARAGVARQRPRACSHHGARAPGLVDGHRGRRRPRPQNH